MCILDGFIDVVEQCIENGLLPPFDCSEGEGPIQLDNISL
jgi:hypothetical protein